MHDHEDRGRDWDQFYAADGEEAPHWSGQPNPALVAEVSTLPPGTALDVGCGADAIWLARQGWQVTALDPSRAALDRGQAAAHAAGVEITWVHAGLLEMPGGTGTHDLVSTHYPVLRRRNDDAAITALIRAVAPGGTLLFVPHEQDPEHATRHGFDAATYVMPNDVEAHLDLDNDWEVEVSETRTRPKAPSRSGQDRRDIVLRARRRDDAR